MLESLKFSLWPRTSGQSLPNLKFLGVMCTEMSAGLQVYCSCNYTWELVLTAGVFGVHHCNTCWRGSTEYVFLETGRTEVENDAPSRVARFLETFLMVTLEWDCTWHLMGEGWGCC
jgi:hypothetical protein